MSERQSSIHVNSAKSTSEQHNNRTQELDYIFPEHSHKNEEWVSESIADRERKIKRLCKQISGRKLQKNAEPIREAVVNLQSHHTMEDLHKLKSDLANMVHEEGKYKGQKKWQFEIIQMYIHHDEGASLKNEKGEKIEPKMLNPDKVNYHAHLVIDWQNKETGKMLRYARGQMADLQTDVANSLNMKRGKERTADKRTANERLGIVEYKAQAQEKELEEIRKVQLTTLQDEVRSLEQKKNELDEQYAEVNREYFRIADDSREVEGRIRGIEEQGARAVERFEQERAAQVYEAERIFKELYENPEGFNKFSEEEINGAIQFIQKRIDEEGNTYKELEEHINRAIEALRNVYK